MKTNNQIIIQNVFCPKINTTVSIMFILCRYIYGYSVIEEGWSILIIMLGCHHIQISLHWSKLQHLCTDKTSDQSLVNN